MAGLSPSQQYYVARQGLNWKIRFKRNQKWSKPIFPFTVALPSPAFSWLRVRAFCQVGGFIQFVCIVLVVWFGVLYVRGVSSALSSRFVGRFMILYYFRLWCSVFIDDNVFGFWLCLRAFWQCQCLRAFWGRFFYFLIYDNVCGYYYYYYF